MPGNYSGITHVNDNVYAIVDDKDVVDGFKFLTLDIDTLDGKVRGASLREPEAMTRRRMDGVGAYRDCEGVAYFHPNNTIFVSGEEDQRIVEYSLDGVPTGRELAIPPIMQRDKILHNLGFEALTYNAHTGRFWTTTESTLPADGIAATAKNPDVHNHLRCVAFDNNLQPCASYIYEMDLPHAHNAKATSIFGVPSLIALDDGRVIVMEREGYFPKGRYGSWVRIKLYEVYPDDSKKVSLDTPMDGISSECYLQKKLLYSFATHLRLGSMKLSNFEGMCRGPRLADGSQTLILIADSQNGMGNWLYHLKDNIMVVRIPSNK